MKKTLLTLIVALLTTAGAWAEIASGTCGAEGDGSNLTWVLDDNGILTISGTGAMTEYRSSHNAPWVSHRDGIKIVVIEDGVTSIGSSAFSYCSALTQVTIGNSVTSIGNYAFDGCSSLTQVTIGNSITSIGNYAFDSCSSLTQITLPESITSIGDGAFWGCSALTQVTIPNSVTSIGNGAFRNTGIYNNESNWVNNVLYINNCLIEAKTELSGSYEMTEGTRLIGDYAFVGCSALTQVTLPNSVTSIGYGAFSGCIALTTINVESDNAAYSSEGGVLFNKDKTTLLQYPIGKLEIAYTIPSSVTAIGASAFSGCASLTQITIPNGVESIGTKAFSYCSALTSVTIPNSVTSIGNEVFYDCNSLTLITIGTGVTTIGEWAFFECDALAAIHVESGNTAYSSESGVLFNKDKTTLLQYPIGKPEIAYTIPSSVTAIGANAFSDCTTLTQITLPAGVKSIGKDAFGYCGGLAAVYYDGDVAGWCGITFDDSFANPLSHAGNLYINNDLVTNLVIPEGITETKAFAFDGCSSITQVTIPASVESIGMWSFNGCNITQLTLPEGVKSIGNGAFSNCKALAQVTLPSSITEIRETAFIECTALNEMTVLATTPPTIPLDMLDYSTFYNVDKSIPVYVPAASIDDYRAAGGWSEFTNYLSVEDKETTALHAPSMPESIRIVGGTLHNPQGLPVSIVDMQGRVVYSGTATAVSQPAGVYVVRCGEASRKVLF